MNTSRQLARTMQLLSQVRFNGNSSSKSGAIREAGGAFSKKEMADEEKYFRNLRAEQLTKLKEDLHDEISFHEEQIKRHQEAIARHKTRVTDLDKKP